MKVKKATMLFRFRQMMTRWVARRIGIYGTYTFYRCKHCGHLVMACDIKEHLGCKYCGCSYICPSHPLLREELGVVIRAIFSTRDKKETGKKVEEVKNG